MTATVTVVEDAATLCRFVLTTVNDALNACERPVRLAYIAAGLVAWDDCCGMLVVAPERVYRTATFPVEGPDADGCYDGTVAVDVVVLVVRCVPVVDDRGNAPSAEDMDAAYGEVLADAAVVWNVMSEGWPDGWQWSRLAQTFVGAEGGCIGVETRMTFGLDQEDWCPECG